MVSDPRKRIEVRKGAPDKNGQPSNIAKRFTRLHIEQQKLMDEAIERGLVKPLDQWDLEELARGKPRNQYGNFSGKAPSWITPHVVQEIRRRLLETSYAELASHVGVAIQSLVKLLTDDSVDEDGKPIVSPALKLQAAKYVIDQTMGQAPQTVDITGLDPSMQSGRTITLLEDAKRKMNLDKEMLVIEAEADSYEVTDDKLPKRPRCLVL